MNFLRQTAGVSSAASTGRVPITRKSVISSATKRATIPVTHIDRRVALSGLAALTPLVRNPPSSQAAEEESATGKLVTRNYGNFKTGNIPEILGSFSPNIVFTPSKFDGSPFKATYKGVEDVTSYFAKLGELETTTKLSLVKVVASGNNAIAFLDYAATVKTTGKSYSTTVIHDWTADDKGALVSLTEYWADTPAAAAAYKA